MYLVTAETFFGVFLGGLFSGAILSSPTSRLLDAGVEYHQSSQLGWMGVYRVTVMENIGISAVLCEQTGTTRGVEVERDDRPLDSDRKRGRETETER